MTRNPSQDQERLRSLLTRWWEESPLDRQWIKTRPVHLYVRKVPLRIGANTFRGFTIGQIDVRGDQQNKGHFKSVISWAKSRPDIEIIKVESVITPAMLAIMQKWEWWSDQNVPQSFYWENSK